jgi:hypothetical protein
MNFKSKCTFVEQCCDRLMSVAPALNSIITVILLGISVFFIMAGGILTAYLSSVQGFTLTTSDLGALGDFVGGLLNPFLTFISICFIAYTLLQNRDALKLSSDELKLTREEMELARKEHAKSAQAQEGILTLESKNIEERNTFKEIENTREELKFRIKLFEGRLNKKHYKDSLNSLRVSFSTMVLRRTLNVSEVHNPGIYIELKDILFEACLMGRIIKEYIDKGQDKKLGRAVCLELGIILKDVEDFFSNLRCLNLDGGDDRVVNHELLSELFREMSEYSLLLNKKMWIDLV